MRKVAHIKSIPLYPQSEYSQNKYHFLDVVLTMFFQCACYIAYMQEYTYIAGVDEAGRGPLAGPVAVGVVVASADLDMDVIEGITDSKKLTAPQRESWLEKIKEIQSSTNLQYTVAYANNDEIDKFGITEATKQALQSCITDTHCIDPDNTKILLDGNLSAPNSFTNQHTITKGDIKEPLISAASICAKVLRDEKMQKYHKQHPEYGFASHKGYPTQTHYAAIEEHGPCKIHRKSYLTKK